jgi:hypothetical protein
MPAILVALGAGAAARKTLFSQFDLACNIPLVISACGAIPSDPWQATKKCQHSITFSCEVHIPPA